jgi:hypothetical protein
MAVFITGTLRSGTSMVAHLLTKSGYSFIDDEKNDVSKYYLPEFNPDGYYERLDIHQMFSSLYQSFCTDLVSNPIPPDFRHNVVPTFSSDQTKETKEISKWKPCLDLLTRIINQEEKKLIGLKSSQFVNILELIDYVYRQNTLSPRKEQPMKEQLDLDKKGKIQGKEKKNGVMIYCMRDKKSVHDSLVTFCRGHSHLDVVDKIPPDYWENHTMKFLNSVHRLASMKVILVNYNDFINRPVECYNHLMNSLSSVGVKILEPEIVEQLVRRKTQTEKKEEEEHQTKGGKIWNILLKLYGQQQQLSSSTLKKIGKKNRQKENKRSKSKIVLK